MRVKLEKNHKDFYTVADLERAKEVIAFEKEDEITVKEWAEYAVNTAVKKYEDYGYCVEVFKAEAHTAKNFRAWNLYGDGTQDMDVWVEATAETVDGMIKVGAYLSDIWQTGAVDYTSHMFVRYFKAV